MKASTKTGGDGVEGTKEDRRSESWRGLFDEGIFEAKNRRGNNCNNVFVRDKL